MMFDELWRAERRASKERKRIHGKYDPLLEKATIEKNERDYQSALSAMMFESDLNTEPDSIRTQRLISRTRRLEIPLPLKPAYDYTERDDDPNWTYHQPTGEWFFTPEKERELVQAVRKEEMERLAHNMRWVSGVVVPITGLLGTFMGLISLVHAFWH